VLFGPAAAMRMLNAVIFTTGSVLLFREARRAFGWLPAYVALLVMLVYPTLFVWSISLLKEPLYLLGTSLVFVSTIRLIRASAWTPRVVAALGLVAGLVIIADLRPGAIVLAASAVVLAIVLREATRTLPRFVAAGALAIVAAIAVVTVPASERRLIGALNGTAKQHAGTFHRRPRLQDPRRGLLRQPADAGGLQPRADARAGGPVHRALGRQCLRRAGAVAAHVHARARVSAGAARLVRHGAARAVRDRRRLAAGVVRRGASGRLDPADRRRARAHERQCGDDARLRGVIIRIWRCWTRSAEVLETASRRRAIDSGRLADGR
jgi:hypothetical protein